MRRIRWPKLHATKCRSWRKLWPVAAAGRCSGYVTFHRQLTRSRALFVPDAVTCTNWSSNPRYYWGSVAVHAVPTGEALHTIVRGTGSAIWVPRGRAHHAWCDTGLTLDQSTQSVDAIGTTVQRAQQVLRCADGALKGFIERQNNVVVVVVVVVTGRWTVNSSMAARAVTGKHDGSTDVIICTHNLVVGFNIIFSRFFHSAVLSITSNETGAFGAYWRWQLPSARLLPHRGRRTGGFIRRLEDSRREEAAP